MIPKLKVNNPAKVEISFQQNYSSRETFFHFSKTSVEGIKMEESFRGRRFPWKKVSKKKVNPRRRAKRAGENLGYSACRKGKIPRGP